MQIGAHANGRADKAERRAIALGCNQAGEDAAERQTDRHDARAAGRAQPVIAISRAGKPLLAGRGLQGAHGRSVAGQQGDIHGKTARLQRLGDDTHIGRRAADTVQQKTADRAVTGVEVRLAQRVERGRFIENAIVERIAGQAQSSFLVWR